MRFQSPFSSASTSTRVCSTPRIWACGTRTTISSGRTSTATSSRKSKPALTVNVPLSLIRFELPAHVCRNSRFTFNCRVKTTSSLAGVVCSAKVRLLIVIRGSKCPILIKAERKSRPRRSRSAVPWVSVRAGQLSNRRKIITTTAATMSATSVNATGQEIRPRVRNFEIGPSRTGICWKFIRSAPASLSATPAALPCTSLVPLAPFRVGRLLLLVPKKVPPPTPDGREGRLFPPEQSSKSVLLVTELEGCRNKILRKIIGLNPISPRPRADAGSHCRFFRCSEMRRLAQFRTARSSFRMRSIDGEKPRSLAGSLLVAHPSMLDPNFRRAVLFLSSHDPDDGALGVIINRPLDKNVADLVSEAPPEGLAKVPVFLGGPVGKHQLMFGAFEWHKGEGLKLNHDVGMDEANTLAGEDPLSICAFVGYAGWGAGQLEAEMKEHAWIVHKPSRSSFQTPTTSPPPSSLSPVAAL